MRKVVTLLEDKMLTNPILTESVRNFYPKLVAEELVPVQPMTQSVVSDFFKVVYVPAPTRWQQFKKKWKSKWNCQVRHKHVQVHDFLYGWICSECRKPWHSLKHHA